MIGNFKLVKKITFMLPHYSSMPITFENVYYDRFNSLFKGYYLIISEEETLDGALDNVPVVRFKRVRSTERFGSQDIIDLVRVEDDKLTLQQKSVIKYLNYCYNYGKYLSAE